ncbi:MAG: DUF2330 domain-containing protein [Planctomycetales bacterium]
MSTRIRIASLAAAGLFFVTQVPGSACCPASPSGKPVVNADQTVIIIWDAATKTQHFIRQASFRSAADDFGFLVPTPSQPELAEAGDEAFPYLLKLTEPEYIRQARPRGGCSIGCGVSGDVKSAPPVRVLAEKLVAGLQTVVLEADSADALVGWLKEHGYAYSPEIEAWAKPYVEAGWKITALKVAKEEGEADQSVAASALRISFQTDRPLFPYREPDPTQHAAALNAKQRLLRIFFISDGPYHGHLGEDASWSGRVAWSDWIGAADRSRVLELLKLPETTGPAEWRLTEFEDDWAYEPAPADVTFARSADEKPIHRPPIVLYVAAPAVPDAALFAFAAFATWRFSRRACRGKNRRAIRIRRLGTPRPDSVS